MAHATGPMDLVASPLRLSGTPPEYRIAPPLLGEHTNEVLRDVLAIPDDEIGALRRAGVV
jgi:crotonobetainyl-CoA:carnitine CoA-transferase CaiB-like acyl-CoA transferase